MMWLCSHGNKISLQPVCWFRYQMIFFFLTLTMYHFKHMAHWSLRANNSRRHSIIIVLVLATSVPFIILMGLPANCFGNIFLFKSWELRILPFDRVRQKITEVQYAYIVCIFLVFFCLVSCVSNTVGQNRRRKMITVHKSQDNSQSRT